MSTAVATKIPTVQQILHAMAFSREQFQDKVEEKLAGALLEHLKANLAVASGQTKWVRHWKSEAHRLLEIDFVIVLLHRIKGFKNRRKAADEVLAHLRAAAPNYVRSAAQIIKKDYSLKKTPDVVPDDALASFFRRVEQILETHAG